MLTNNKTYGDSAKRANKFVQFQLYNVSLGLIMDGVDLKTCEQSTWAFTYDMGLYLEGLSVLATISDDSNMMGL